jgi:hypothetical protein
MRRWRRGGDGGAAGSGEGGRKGKGAWPGGLAQHTGLLGAKKAEWLLGCLGQTLKEKSFQNKNWILNILGLWKFI